MPEPLAPGSPAPAPMVFSGLLREAWQSYAFQPFREGVEICSLYEGEPAVALLKYRPGASVPRHRHLGLETIMVLDGAQSDERGRHDAGSVVLNPAGFEHSVWSDEGCVVLIHWSRPVEFIDAAGFINAGDRS